jgi:hypothetical protein
MPGVGLGRIPAADGALTASSASAMAAAMVCVDAARDLPHQSGLAVEGAALVSTAEDSDIADRTGRQAAA